MADSVSPSLPATRRYDDPRSIAVLVFFLLAALVTIRPMVFPISLPDFVFTALYKLRLQSKARPAHCRKYHVNINLNVGPLAAVLILLASKCIGTVEVRAGIKGVGDLHPYDILLLFLSLAYIAISLDATGALQFLAFSVAKKGGTSGRRLHFFLFLFFFILGGIVGNDPIILSGTAFLSYFTKACGNDPPTAWIFSQFMAANLSSMVFVSSNPTNLVVSSGSQINFIYFSGWTVLPAIFAGIVLYPILMLQFFRQQDPPLIPRKLQIPDLQPRKELNDVHGAIFKAVLLFTTLVALIVSSVFVTGLYVWWVTVPAAVVALSWDVIHDWKSNARHRKKKKHEAKLLPADAVELECAQTKTEIKKIESATNGDQTTDAIKGQRTANSRWDLPHLVTTLDSQLPTVYTVVTRLPWPLLPFAFSEFILVDSLSSSGWITLWAGWMSDVVQNNDVVAIFCFGLISIIFCNIMTNIGSTVLLVDLLYNDSFLSANPSMRVRYGGLFAIVVGSNIGAYSFVFPASLAGLLWRGILKQKGIHVRSVDFFRWNVVPLVVTTLVALATVVAEVGIIFPE